MSHVYTPINRNFFYVTFTRGYHYNNLFGHDHTMSVSGLRPQAFTDFHEIFN